MDHYRRQPLDKPASDDSRALANTAIESAGRTLRQLLPFASSGDLSSLEIPLMTPRRSTSPENAATSPLLPAGGLQAAAIVSEAASILDEEMAKGVLAARGASPLPRYRDVDQTTAVLRQVHDVIDNVARIFPTLQGASSRWPAGSLPATNDGEGEPLPILKPASAVRPGQPATLSMMLCNKENRSVRLSPVSTDLISSTGSRISSQSFEFVPSDVRVEPGDQREMQARIFVPGGTAPGCYVGLLVVTGVEYLRALITIDVE